MQWKSADTHQTQVCVCVYLQLRLTPLLSTYLHGLVALKLIYSHIHGMLYLKIKRNPVLLPVLTLDIDSVNTVF